MKEETKKKLSEIKKGKHYSPETEFISEEMIGKNNPNWNGGITPLCQSIRQLDEFIQWRNEVFKRDDYICQECNIRGNTLHVHHKTPFITIINTFDIKNIIDAINCNLLWNINNGITLCKKCHIKCHSSIKNKK